MLQSQTLSKKQIAESYAHRIWDLKDLSAIDDLMHKDIILHSLLGDFKGKESMRNVIQAWYEGFPDLKVENLSILSENDQVVIHWKASGRHQGEFKGIPASGKKVSYAGVTIYRIQEDKISEYWAYLDLAHIFQQIKS
ncbi:MAG: ester cyclase [Parachlamydiaceae bacterium]|nr:MAG: ester cyclase [Parachlamydiaceae bacterium]